MHVDARPMLGILAAMALLPAAGHAQSTPSHAPPNTEHRKQIQGTVRRLDDNELLLAARGGTTETYQLSPAVQIVRSQPAQWADLQAGQFVTCMNLYGDSPRRVASDCHIFPADMHGFAKSPGDTDPPDPAEISGTVTDIRTAAAGTAGRGQRMLLQLTDRGPPVTLAVTPATVITRLSRGDASMLRPGAKLSGISQQAVDGTQVIQTLTVTSAGRER